MSYWLYVHAGLSSPNSPWYLFWSGVGADWTRIIGCGGLLWFGQMLTRHHKERLEQAERHHRELTNDAAE